ncbi:MaoC family dehydratase [Halopiger djelfimassiliensis]|uniref:MaoC family dehydratase n=1 Tax=Halopiger djelfimassiliensis TaxID=1293047 RepID=UPI000677EC3B|nr:dehydratase [Halopiger djelfimassiliensis]
MEEPREGETVTYERTFIAEEGQQFADLSGDAQPRHTEPNEDGRVMVHGLLTATIPTKSGGDREVMAPRMGFEFLQSVYTGERVICFATDDKVVKRDARYEITWDVVCENEAGEAVLNATIDGISWKDF